VISSGLLGASVELSYLCVTPMPGQGLEQSEHFGLNKWIENNLASCTHIT
jgi:hypothetical protein